MVAFYFLGVTEFQDMITPLIELQKLGKNSWVCIFDCLDQKRQFYYYEKEELINYVKQVCISNNVPIPDISFFGLEDEKKFAAEYDERSPKTVFIQSLSQKYPRWMPKADNSNIVHFSWGTDGISNLQKTKYKNIVLNIARYKGDLKQSGTDFVYLGNFRLEQLLYTPIEKNISFLKSMGSSKICFVPESWVYYYKDPNRALKFTNEVITELKNNEYKIVWKKREKGYPIDSTRMLSLHPFLASALCILTGGHNA